MNTNVNELQHNATSSINLGAEIQSIPRPAQERTTPFQAFSRFVIGKVLSLRYRIKPSGMENIPKTGAAILAPNHVSYIDALAIAKHCGRPIRFVMAKAIFDLPVLNGFLKQQRAIPIASAKDDPAALEKAFDRISKALKNGELVCIFPEGKLTKDGEIGEFKAGIAKILARDPVPVVPLALRGLWGSIFTHRPQGLFHFAKRILGRRKILIEAGEPIAPHEAHPEKIREIISTMRGKAR